MATDFQRLVIDMVKEEGIGIFDRLTQCRDLLKWHAKNEYNREIRLLLISVEAGCHRELLKDPKSDSIKVKLIQKLQDEYGITPAFAEETISTLEAIIKGTEPMDTSDLNQLEKAAKKGDYRAQYKLALLYEKQQNYEAASHWFKEAAKQGAVSDESALKKSALLHAQKNQGERSVPLSDSFILINGGSFMMGSPLSEPEREINETQHHVKVSSFYLSKSPVTQKEYEELIGTNPSNFRGADLPVEYISWYDAVNYCNRRSEQEGLLSAYIINKARSDPNNGNEFDSNKWLVTWDLKANGYRLPTEAEWEYACRAGTKTSFNTGNNITVAQANYNGSGGKTDPLGKTTPVGSFPPNPWGLYDMHGNVWEWCWDWYRNYSLGVNQADPMGATFGTQRILRGGSWNKKIQHIRSAYRIGSTPSLRSGDFGFRVARSSLGGDLQ